MPEQRIHTPCSGCGAEADPNRPQGGETVIVQVSRLVTTAFEGGYPSGGEKVTVAGGVYCSRSCAARALSAPVEGGAQ